MATSERRTLSITAKLVDLFTRPLGKAQGSFVAFSRSVASSAKSIFDRVFNLKTAVLGLATSFFSLSTVKAFGEQADALIKLANSTGDTIGNLSELQAAFSLAGLQAESFNGVLKQLLTQTSRAQQQGGEKLAQSFAELGISIQDLQQLAPSQLFEKIALGLESYRTQQEKVVALGKLLPEQFQNLLPILGGGLQKFQAAIREARESGATITEAQAKTAERLNDSLSKVQLSIGAVSRALIQEFGPQAIAFFEGLAKGIVNNRDQIVDFAKVIGRVISQAFGLAADAVIGFIRLIEKIPGLDVGGFDEQIAAVQSQLGRLRADSRLLGSVIANAYGKDEEIAKLERQLAELQASAEMGLAGLLQKTRADFLASVTAIGEQITITPDINVEWSPEDIRRYQEGLAKGLQGAVGNSVFQAPNGPALPDTTEFEEGLERAAESAGKVKTRLQEALPREAFGGNFWDGFNAGANEAIIELTDFTAAGQFAAQQLLVGGFNGLSDAFADVIMGTKSAKEAFRDFAVSMLSDLSRLIARMLILNALQAGFGGLFGGGGATPGTSPSTTVTTTGFGGGAALGGGLKSIGAGLAPALRSAPAMAMGAGGGTNLTFNISAVDGKDVQRLLIDQRQTITAIWQNEIKSVTGSRNLVKAAAR